MGCDWQIFVQGLCEIPGEHEHHDNGEQQHSGAAAATAAATTSSKRWVTLTDEYSKTGCGGNPVRYIIRKYIEACNADTTATLMGSFGVEFPIQDAIFDGSGHWTVTQAQEELDCLAETYDTETGQVKAKKQKTEDGGAKRDYLEAAEVLEKRDKLLGDIKKNTEKIKEFGILEGNYPEWECFHMSTSEYQGLCDALLGGEHTCEHYYDTYANLLEWAELLEGFQRDTPSTSRADKTTRAYACYQSRSGKECALTALEYVKKEVKDWKANLVVKQMMPELSNAIGCHEDQVGSHILGFVCGDFIAISPPTKLRFAIHCEEGHLEFYRKGQMKGAHAFDGSSCCVM